MHAFVDDNRLITPPRRAAVAGVSYHGAYDLTVASTRPTESIVRDAYADDDDDDDDGAVSPPLLPLRTPPLLTAGTSDTKDLFGAVSPGSGGGSVHSPAFFSSVPSAPSDDYGDYGGGGGNNGARGYPPSSVATAPQAPAYSVVPHAVAFVEGSSGGAGDGRIELLGVGRLSVSAAAAGDVRFSVKHKRKRDAAAPGAALRVSCAPPRGVLTPDEPSTRVTIKVRGTREDFARAAAAAASADPSSGGVELKLVFEPDGRRSAAVTAASATMAVVVPLPAAAAASSSSAPPTPASHRPSSPRTVRFRGGAGVAARSPAVSAEPASPAAADRAAIPLLRVPIAGGVDAATFLPVLLLLGAGLYVWGGSVLALLSPAPPPPPPPPAPLPRPLVSLGDALLALLGHATYFAGRAAAALGPAFAAVVLWAMERAREGSAVGPFVCVVAAGVAVLYQAWFRDGGVDAGGGVPLQPAQHPQHQAAFHPQATPPRVATPPTPTALPARAAPPLSHRLTSSGIALPPLTQPLRDASGNDVAAAAADEPVLVANRGLPLSPPQPQPQQRAAAAAAVPAAETQGSSWGLWRWVVALLLAALGACYVRGLVASRFLLSLPGLDALPAASASLPSGMMPAALVPLGGSAMAVSLAVLPVALLFVSTAYVGAFVMTNGRGGGGGAEAGPPSPAVFYAATVALCCIAALLACPQLFAAGFAELTPASANHTTAPPVSSPPPTTAASAAQVAASAESRMLSVVQPTPDMYCPIHTWLFEFSRLR